MVVKRKLVIRLLLPIFLLLFFCEYVVYYVVLFQCGWPILQQSNEEASIAKGDGGEVKVMLLADTHLLGSKKGHWFDKLRREWQMHRAFQTAVNIHKPQIVFVLGDLFDEGLWCSDAEFNAYVQRFHSLFHVPKSTQMHVVVGNHDIGFHYGISPYLQERFVQAFNAPSVRLLTVEGNHFVLINSMAMEGDGCFLCRPAELQVNKIASRLQCARGVGKCRKGMGLKQYSRPILLQHFPMYRESDAECNEPDEAPEDEKNKQVQGAMGLPFPRELRNAVRQPEPAGDTDGSHPSRVPPGAQGEQGSRVHNTFLQLAEQGQPQLHFGCVFSQQLRSEQVLHAEGIVSHHAVRVRCSTHPDLRTFVLPSKLPQAQVFQFPLKGS